LPVQPVPGTFPFDNDTSAGGKSISKAAIFNGCSDRGDTADIDEVLDEHRQEARIELEVIRVPRDAFRHP
jgi:hypothetical protein